MSQDDPQTGAPPPPSVSSPSHANSGGVGIGIEGGPIFNTFSEANVSFSNRTGWIGGLFVGGNRTGVIGVQGELLVARKGATNSAGQSIDLTFLEVPVLLRVNVGSGSVNGARVYLLVGPAADVKLKATQAGTDVGASYTGVDIDGVGGVGVEVARISLEGRYTRGFRNIQNVTTTPTAIHTQSFAVVFGIRFN